MRASGKKYIILAMAGAIILGIGVYLLLNNYLEKVEIIVAKHDIGKGQKIEEKDISFVRYYKDSLPEGFVINASEILGKTITVDRKSGDPVTQKVFEENRNKKLQESLEDDELLMAININYTEPLVDELAIGSHICIVSTEKEKDFNFYNNNKLETENDTLSSEFNYINQDNYSISENIFVIEGQLIIKNIEILNIKRETGINNSFTVGEAEEKIYVFVKCNVKEAPVISRITKEDNYKIFLEKF